MDRNRLSGNLTLTGSILCLVTAGLHLLSHVRELQPSNPQEEQLFDLVRNYVFDLGGIRRTFEEIHLSMSWALSLFSAFLGVMGIFFLKAGMPERTRRAGLGWQLVFMLALAVDVFVYTFSIPMICWGSAAAFLLAGYLLIPKTGGQSPHPSAAGQEQV